MSSSIPEPIQLNPVANSKRIYLILGLFVVIMIIIFKVFFEDKVRQLILGDIYLKPEPEEPVQLDEVYNVGNNIYTYDEANSVCNSLNAKLATHDQVVNAYKNGAEWCNYGWSSGQNALFPIQKETWEEIQTRPTDYRNECGDKYGVNGGFFENSELKFGVNCYGVKPEGGVAEDYRISSYEAPGIDKLLSSEDIAKLGIIPFNETRWSEYN
jgi:hypothetical protein